MGEGEEDEGHKRKTSDMSAINEPLSPVIKPVLSSTRSMRATSATTQGMRAPSKRSHLNSLTSADEALEKTLVTSPAARKESEIKAQIPSAHHVQIMDESDRESEFDSDEEEQAKDRNVVLSFLLARPFKVGIFILGAIITIAGACMKGISAVDVRQVPEALLFVGTSLMMGLVADIVVILIGGLLTWMVSIAEKKHKDIEYTFAVIHFYYTSVIYRISLLFWDLMVIVLFTSFVPRVDGTMEIAASWELAYYHLTRLLGIFAMVLFARVCTQLLRMYLTQDFGVRSFSARVKDTLDEELLCCKLRNVRPAPAFISLIKRLRQVSNANSFDPELWQAVVRHVNHFHADGFEVATSNGKHQPVKPGQDHGLGRRARPVAASIFARLIATIKIQREELLQSESEFYFEQVEDTSHDGESHDGDSNGATTDSGDNNSPVPSVHEEEPSRQTSNENPPDKRSTARYPSRATSDGRGSPMASPLTSPILSSPIQRPAVPPMRPLGYSMRHMGPSVRFIGRSAAESVDGGDGHVLSSHRESMDSTSAEAAAAAATSIALQKINIRRADSFHTIRTNDETTPAESLIQDHQLDFDADDGRSISNKSQSHMNEIEEVPLEALAVIAEEISFVQNADITSKSKRELLSHLSSRLGNKVFFKEEVLCAFKQLDSAYDWESVWKKYLDPRETGVVTWPRMRTMVFNFYETRYNLSLSIQDSKSCIKSMDVVIMSVFMVLVILISLTFYTSDVGTLLSSIGTVVLGYKFIFGGSVTTSFENIVFLFGVHPYDVGDIVLFNSNRYTVSRIRLLTTDFIQADGAMMRLTNTYVAGLGPIFNLNTSEKHSVGFSIYLPATDVREANIVAIRASLEEFFKANSLSFESFGFTAREFIHPMQANGELPSKGTHATHIRFYLWVTYKFSFENAGRIYAEQTRLITFLCERLQELGLSKPLTDESHHVFDMPPSGNESNRPPHNF
mmetsp:Transcript_11374/g.22230  ORF Transcript_11374/g.22230 Transcript_11374/m.22230 type:complete len:966 (+) Transcript_11374:987-3884(+)